MTKRQALVIGINEYPHGDSLSTAAQDAEKIAQLLEEYGSFEVHRLPIYDKREVSQDLLVTSSELEVAITQLFQPKSGIIPETALLFFAGHGWRSEKNGQPEGFLVTSEASFKEDCDKGLFSLKRLHQILKDSPVRQQIVWLDCCHSGELFNFIEQKLEEFEQQRGVDRCFIAACREFQVAYGGVLTPALLQALDPTNKDDGIVTNHTLKPRLEAIPNNASQHFVVRNIGSQIILTYKGGVRGNICPYKGLKYFDFNPTKPEEAEDHRYFYGRTQLTNQLLDKVRSSNFIAVIGASGSGKSSVVRAGLLYQLYLGKKIPGSDRWTIYQPFTPGINPIKSLEQVVGKLTAPDDLVHFIERLPTERVVLVIDQFEEIFTQCLDEKERQKFFMYLMGAVESLENKLCLVLVMRDDFQQKCTDQEYPGLPHKIENNLVRVLRMNRPELQEVILKPAELVELEIDRDLVNEMIADVLDSAGDLALLQYTLTQLWENRSFNLLTISDYTSLGGVQKVLGNHADTVYQSLLSEEQKADGLKESEEQKAARRIFLELTRLSEDENTPNTRQQVWLKDLVNSQQSEELVNKVLQRLAYEKLVVTSKQELEGQRVEVVNIVHETLIRNWGFLGGWLKENRKALIIKQDIKDALNDWRDKSNSNDYLLSGKKLADAENFLHKYGNTIHLSSVTEDFINRSINHRKNSRIRFILFWLIIPFGLLIYLGFFAQRSIMVSQLRADFENAQEPGISPARTQALEKLVKAGESLANTPLSNTDLSKANLHGADFRGANLKGADLSNTNLSDANFSDADLSDANLNGADIRRTKLGNTNLKDAYLKDAYLKDAKLNSADLTNAVLSGANLSSADLSGANLSSADLSGADLSGANLKNTILKDAYLGDANLNSAILNNANLKDAYLGGVNLSNADLTSAKITAAKNLTYEQIKSARNLEQGISKKLIPSTTNQWKTINVVATKGWIRSNICFKKSSTVNIFARGKWSNGNYIRPDTTEFRPFYGAEGHTTSSDSTNNLPLPTSTNSLPLPTAKVGTLIGKIDNSKPFRIGLNYKSVQNKYGCLYLAINDSKLSDNQGEIKVFIQIKP
jgi:uncharacterized protein YjbI with pentapeptide repeats